MAAKSTMKNMVICLAAVCLVCSFVLGMTNDLTSRLVADSAAAAEIAAISEVLPDGGEIVTEPETVTVDGISFEAYLRTVDGEYSGCAVKSKVQGFGGDLTVLVGVQKDGVVCNTKVLSHSETPGLGAKCADDEAFLSQFRGFDASSRKLSLKKDGGEIDAITASTITSRAYTLAVSNAVKAAALIQEEQGR